MHNPPNSHTKTIPPNSSLPKLERSHLPQLLSRRLCIYCGDHNYHPANQLLLRLNQPKSCKIQIDTLANNISQLQLYSAQVTNPDLQVLATSSLILNS
jgi:hypothetical protein